MTTSSKKVAKANQSFTISLKRDSTFPKDFNSVKMLLDKPNLKKIGYNIYIENKLIYRRRRYD